MKKSFQVLLVMLLLVAAFHTRLMAGVSCSVPFNLINGTTADASQVMANYNAILACLANNTAESGANDSITALVGLTTPLSPASGGSTNFIGAASTGTNAIVVATTSPSNFTLTAGYRLVFTAGFANTAAATLNAAGTGVKNLYRQTPSGPQPMVGGEIIAGQIVEVSYDGTQYQMLSTPALGHVPGEVFDFAGFSCPVGSLEATGSALVSQSAYPTLFANIANLWGASGGGNFTIPDLQGRTTYSRGGSTNRITAAGGNFDGTVVGRVGGQQNTTVDQAHLAAFSLTVTDPGHNHATNVHNSNTAFGNPAGHFPGIVSGFGGGNGNIYSGTSDGVNGFASNFIANATTGITVASGGGGTALPVLSNAAIVLKCIKG